MEDNTIGLTQWQRDAVWKWAEDNLNSDELAFQYISICCAISVEEEALQSIYIIERMNGKLRGQINDFYNDMMRNLFSYRDKLAVIITHILERENKL